MCKKTTEQFGFSTGPATLQGMLEAGIINDPEERYIVFLWGKGGKADVYINLKKHTLQKDTLLVLLPNFHIEVEEAETFRCEYIYYTFDFMAELPFSFKPAVAEKAGKKPCIQLSEKEVEILKIYFDLLIRHYQRTEHPSRLELVKATLFMWIAEINMLYSQEVVNLQATHAEQLTDQFFKLLHDHHAYEHKPVFYADKMCLTVRYLSKVLKQVTGKSLNTWVVNFSIIAAKKYLKSTTLTSSQIAEEMNFPNPSFFAKYFKKYTGITPMEFRRLKG